MKKKLQRVEFLIKVEEGPNKLEYWQTSTLSRLDCKRGSLGKRNSMILLTSCQQSNGLKIKYKGGAKQIRISINWDPLMIKMQKKQCGLD